MADLKAIADQIYKDSLEIPADQRRTDYRRKRVNEYKPSEKWVIQQYITNTCNANRRSNSRWNNYGIPPSMANHRGNK